MHLPARTMLCSTQLAFRKRDEILDDPRRACIRMMPTVTVRSAVSVRSAMSVPPAVTVVDARKPELAAQRVQSVNVATVVRFATRLFDLAIDPRFQAPLDVLLRMRIAVRRCSLPSSGDVQDLLVVLPLLVHFTPRLRETTRPMVVALLRVVHRRLGLSPDGSRNARAHLWRDDDGRVPFAAPPILSIGLAHGGEGQRKESKMK